jgi:mannose-6-phosphate isomerase-like protein (cupin superfamily)
MKLQEVFLREAEGFSTNIEKDTLANKNFRKVLFTSPHSQVVLMSIVPGGEIGEESHTNPAGDQFIRVEKGEGKAIIAGKEFPLSGGSIIVIPTNTEHNVLNMSSSEPLQLYTVYSPAQHKHGVVHKTKEEAEKDKTDIPAGAK